MIITWGRKTIGLVNGILTNDLQIYVMLQIYSPLSSIRAKVKTLSFSFSVNYF